jgi:ribonuclease HI
MKIEIYTDGSSMFNGKDNCYAGWAAVFYLNDKQYVRYGHLPAKSSNNKGEIYGVLYAMNLFKEKKDWQIQIYSDSLYVVKAINEWRKAWERRDYCDVKNMDLFEPLFAAWDQHGNAKISWVKGHKGNVGNEAADEYAGMGLRNIEKNLTSDKLDVMMLNDIVF